MPWGVQKVPNPLNSQNTSIMECEIVLSPLLTKKMVKKQFFILLPDLHFSDCLITDFALNTEV